MKRPLACVGFGILSALTAAVAFKPHAVYVAAGCIALSAALFALRIFCGRETKAYAVFFLSASAAAAVFVCTVSFYEQPLIDKYDGERVSFSGVIISQPYTNGESTRFVVRTDEINGKPEKIKISVTSSSVPDGREYDFISATAVLNRIYDDEEAGLGYASYSAARHIFFSAYISPYTRSYFTVEVNDSPPAAKVLCDIRERVSQTLFRSLSYNEAAVCAAMITGSKYYLPDEINEQFRMLGISHLLVVSGMHLSIVAAFVFTLTRSSMKSKLLSCIIGLFAVFVFAVFTGMGFSTARAFIMLALSVVGQILNFKNDPLNSLGLAAIIICLDPFAAGDVGLLWSFSCVLAIILLSGGKNRDKESLEGLFSDFSSAVRTTAAAMVGSIPFIVLVTHVFSPYMLAVNLFAVPAAGIIVIFAGAGVLISLAGAAAFANLLIFPAGAAARYLLSVAELFGERPYSGVSADRPAVVLWLAATVIMFVLMHIFSADKFTIKTGAVLSAAVLAAVFSVDIFMNAEKITLSVLDSPGGITSILTDCGGTSVLCAYGDSGNYYTIKSALESCDVRCIVDIPPPGKSYGYGRRIIDDFGADMVIVNDKARMERSYSWYQYCGGDVRLAGEKYVLYLDNSAVLEIYASEELAFGYLTICGREILFCEGGEGRIPEAFCSPDIAVMSDDEHFGELDGSVGIILSNRSRQYFDERIIAAADSSHSVNAVFSPDGDIYIEKG